MAAVNTIACAPRFARGLAFVLAATLAVPGCSHVIERRVSTSQPDYEDGTVVAKVERREGRRYATWKPYVAAATLLVLVGASGMIVYGLYRPDHRAVANTGIVISAGLPLLIGIPYVVDRKRPWVETRWKDWQPDPRVDARIDVVGRHDRPLATTKVPTDASGQARVQLDLALCPAPKWRDLGMVDLVVSVPKSDEEATVALPVDRLRDRVQCSGSLTLLGTEGRLHL